MADWTGSFGYVGSNDIDFTYQYNCGSSSDVLIWLTTEQNVRSEDFGCKVKAWESTPVACFRPWSWTYDNFLGRHEVTVAIIPVWKAWIDSHGYAIHVFEHEIGHAMGLAHHDNCSPYVMEDEPCYGWWKTSNSAMQLPLCVLTGDGRRILCGKRTREFR